MSATLICPACRHAHAGSLVVRTLRQQGQLLRCECGRKYPIIDNIPVLLTDLAGWAASEGADALRDRRISAELLPLLVGADSASARNMALVEVYRTSPPSPYTRWLKSTITRLPGLVLEVGAGIGHRNTVRLDLNLALLRAGAKAIPPTEGPQGVTLAAGGAVVANAADPPFLAEAFDAVVLSNLIDSCRDPFTALAQSDALVKPGGTLVITCAYAFQDAITPVDARFSPEQLDRALRGTEFFGPYPIGSRRSEEVQERRWTLRVSDRTHHVHRVECSVARKVG